MSLNVYKAQFNVTATAYNLEKKVAKVFKFLFLSDQQSKGIPFAIIKNGEKQGIFTLKRLETTKVVAEMIKKVI